MYEGESERAQAEHNAGQMDASQAAQSGNLSKGLGWYSQSDSYKAGWDHTASQVQPKSYSISYPSRRSSGTTSTSSSASGGLVSLLALLVGVVIRVVV